MPESSPIDQITAADLPLRLGRYELQSILGEGGMARVFRAELRGPAGFRKAVALKVIKVEAGQSVSTQQVLSLIKEACLGGRLKHPNLVDVYELGEVGKQLFISMELVEGETLHKLLRSKDPIPPAVMMEIAVSMTAGLARAHGQVSEAPSTGMVHRDLKPSNILLSVDGEVKISDFGVAISREEARDAFPASVGGTVSYMSPEQMKGEALDGRSDLFSLGLVIAEMVLGYKPLGDDVRKQQLAGLALRSPLLTRNQFSALNDVISGIGELLLRCLEPEKENRIPNAAQLLEELQQLQEQVGYTPRLRTWFSQRNKSAKKSAVPVREPAKGGARSPLMDDTTAILPPTKALGNIIPSLDQFVGRESELAQLAKCFETGARLVTVKGTGGAGKTRFARRFAHRHREELAGGAWFIDLTEARTPKSLLHATAMALEVPLGGEDFDGMVTKVGHAISGRGPVLLVLDNFEQVVQHASVTVGPWLKMAPEASFLVTSRERLRLEGEQVFALEPLPEADGVALFELRARAAGASLGEDPQTRTAITRIVTALDGLPLAIELAAARAVLLSPTQLLERLSERFELLRGGRRGDTDRQSSLVGLIDWSWDLLEPWEQAALAQLSVFRDGFFMEAAEAVLDLSAWRDAPWSLDVVGSLLDKSLLHTWELHGQPRFGIYVSIQEYAEEKLGEETAATALLHAQHFASFGTEAFLDSLDTYGGVEQCKNLALELENLLVGLDAGLAAGEPETGAGCALAAAAVFGMQGPFSDGIALLERVLGQPVGRRRQGRLFLKAGWLLHSCGRPVESLESFQQALAIHREVGDRRGEGISLRGLALLHRHQARISEALEHYSQALIIAREMGDRGNEGGALAGLATAQHEVGRVSEALESFQQALAIHREMGARRIEGITLGNLALLHHDQGHNPETLECYSQALAIHREVGSRLYEGNILGGLALYHHDQGNIPEALEHYSRALAIHREVGNRRFEGVALGNLGDLLSSQGDLQSAEASLRGAIAIGDETLPVAAGAFRGSLALIRAQQGALDEARELLEMGESQVRGVYQLELGKLLCKKARVEHLAGDPSASATALAEAESIADELKIGPESDLGQLIVEAREAISG